MKGGKNMKGVLSGKSEKHTLRDLWQYVDMIFIAVLFILLLCVEIIKAYMRTVKRKLFHKKADQKQGG